MANNAKMLDLGALIQAGIDPKTGLPIRMADRKARLKEDIRRSLRIMDEQEAINRYTWYNLPNGIDGHLLERILYYKGQGMFFYMPTDECFYFLPYALDGSIDVYGRYTGVTPLPFNGTAKGKEDAWITGLIRKPVYDIEQDLLESNIEEKCVLLHDYSKQLSQNLLPRQQLNEPLLEMMAEALPLARTSLISRSGIAGMRVPDEDSQSNVKAASRSVQNAALEGDPWIPIVGNLEFQDLSNKAGSTVDEPLLYMQTVDNLRQSLIGITSGGIFRKSGNMLQSEMDANQQSTGLIYQDGLAIRQRFCDQVNSIWPWLMIWCEPSETQVMADMNGDGMLCDAKDQSGIPGDQPQIQEDIDE